MAEKRGMPVWMQWTIYLGIAALSGLLWFPVGHHVNREFLSGNPFDTAGLVTWHALTGLLTALAYRCIGGGEDSDPPPWVIAILFPGIAVLGCIGTMTFQGGGIFSAEEFLMTLLFGNLAAYIALGWLIIPLAIPYAMMMRLAHRETIRFASQASPRHVRQVAWGLACLGVLGMTELPRLRGYSNRSAYAQATAYIPVHLPAGTELIHSRFEVGPEGNRTMWFQSKSPLPWPLVADQQALSAPDDREAMRVRAAMASIKTDAATQFEQGKWISNGRTVQATLVRTKQADFLEVIPW